MSRAWLRNLTNASNEENWTDKPRLKDEPDVEKIPLKQIGCPECGHIQETANNRLQAKIGFGQMTCKTCRHSTEDTATPVAKKGDMWSTEKRGSVRHQKTENAQTTCEERHD